MTKLTRDEATTRAGLLRVTGYDIDLDLTAAKESDTFGSVTTVRFTCAGPGATTFLELKPTAVAEITLNGTALDAGALDDNRLPLTDLAAENQLTVRATMAYSRTGEGLHKFTDPEDGEVYLYAQTFLDDAQRMFACFDQPDLKAPVTLTASAPPDWSVWSNGAGTRTAPGRWEFATTKPLATYFTTIVAGPYHARYDEHDGIALGLQCRRSMAPFLDKDAEEIFDITKACLDRYHELFGIRYPFGKYDQAFVPEFNAGAMENPGCVTFRDEFVFRSAVTDSDREIRAVVIAHEMAHMWFGDLVTLRWWDDIWLNESFAEYMGWRISVEATRFTDAWTSFGVARKGQGYTADQRPSTHPVAPELVSDTAMALLNFDGISYAKGASVLRQLVAWVGDEAFMAGLRAHFTTHAYGNATLADLLVSLSEASGRDLASWAEVWLRRPQVNTLRPEVHTGEDGRYADVTVVQTAPAEYPTLRPHRIGVGVYGGDGPAVLLHRTEVDLDPDADDGRTPVTALAGSEAGKLLLLNDGDLTFAKVRFDPASRTALTAVLPALEDSLARAVIWAAAGDSVRDAEMSPGEYLALADAGLPAETSVSVFGDVARLAADLAIARYLPPEARPAAQDLLVEACLRTLRTADPGSSRQLAAARAVAGVAGQPHAGLLAGWLAGREVPEGLAVDAELRWALLFRLVVLGESGEADIAAETERDPSGQGAEHAARCRSALPTAEAKAEAWRVMVSGDASVSVRFQIAAAEGFWHPEQDELTAPYVSRFFAEMPEMARRSSPMATYQIARSAFPSYAVAAETVAEAEAMLARDDLDATLRRVVVDATDELRRSVNARSLA